MRKGIRIRNGSRNRFSRNGSTASSESGPPSWSSSTAVCGAGEGRRSGIIRRVYQVIPRPAAPTAALAGPLPVSRRTPFPRPAIQARLPRRRFAVVLHPRAALRFRCRPRSSRRPPPAPSTRRCPCRKTSRCGGHPASRRTLWAAPQSRDRPCSCSKRSPAPVPSAPPPRARGTRRGHNTDGEQPSLQAVQAARRRNTRTGIRSPPLSGEACGRVPGGPAPSRSRPEFPPKLHVRD